MANATGADTKFSGDEFSNNLFSDLAPLLTLFGEQVTKQFLSMSLGWADNILLGMGPLGIMTIIVSAIRVGGVRQLKALVGRYVVIIDLVVFVSLTPSLERGRASQQQSRNFSRPPPQMSASSGAARR